ncbi:sugar-binding domain-containing protein [Halococcus hamelinensis]|uniref:Beta-galactosidase n=1 Tax=Halococcus hamelinensis 100A6 TaxID=1132509 RepID=M0M0X4_9EURY|nr:sugar-binding domain-containing protein [Halococcus hamelinensis]EMA38005.1 Beta-galactosidase [Halococcus hamelinensis 100A6]
MNAFDRPAAVDLSGEWTFTTDPDDVGIAEHWYERDESLPNSRGVTVPHAWQEHDDLREYTGVAWYRRTVTLDGFDDRVRLRFGAVDYRATVWVNGVEVGSNEGGYLPFAFDVTEAVVPGENVVAVRVADPDDLREIPHGKQGYPWYTRVSGIWQPVDITTVPETRIADLRVTPDLDADAARVDVDIANIDRGADLRLRIRVTQDGTTLGTDELPVGSETVSTVVSLTDPAYWTPDDPELCDVEVSLLTDGGSGDAGIDEGDKTVVDRLTDYFGMRSVSVENGEWYLNGEVLRVRGALDQAYYPDTLYRPADLDTYREEIATAKELGFNMLRKHIKPAHPRFVELADRMGILVWEEPANADVDTDASRRRVREAFEGLVARDYNSPSVVVWSLYNEEWGFGIDQHDFPDRDDPVRLWNDSEKQSYLADYYREARDLDPTRLVCDNSGWAHVATDLNDYHEYFVVPDRNEAWRDRLDDLLSDPAGNYAATGDGPAPEEVPTVVSEFGTWGLPELSSLRAHYGGDPDWFDHEFLSGLKRPAGVEERFEDSALSDVYDGLDDLAADWQRRAFASVAGTVADMRLEDEVSGYVLTEFTDIEWEFNGVLDYLREGKASVDRLAAANGRTMVRLEPDTWTLRTGDRFVADLAVANDGPEPLETAVEWTAFGESGREPVRVDPAGTTRLDGVIDLRVPKTGTGDEEVSTETATADLVDTPAHWESEVTVVGGGEGGADTRVFAPTEAEAIRSTLTDAGYDPLGAAADADTLVTTDFDERARAFATDGGHVVLLPRPDGSMADSVRDAFPIRELPERESWNLCASFVYQTLFDGVKRVPGWAFEGLYPYAYVTPTADGDSVHSGYVEGWLSEPGATVLERDDDDGRVTVCTLRVTGSENRPMSGAIVRRLVD